MRRLRTPIPTEGLVYRRRMLIVLVLGWAVLQGGRFLLPPLLPRITETLGFSAAGIGLALTALGLVYAVTQYPSGSYSDMLSRATLLVPGFGLVLVAFIVIGLSVTAWLFVVGILLLGVGKGLVASPSRALVSDLFEHRRGRALGIYTAATDVGALLASGLAVLVLATTTWRMGFLPVVVVLALVLVLFLVWNRESYTLEWVTLSPVETAGRIAATREQRELVVVFAVFYFFVGGLTNFFPTLLVDGGFTETAASGMFALLFAVGLIVKPGAGELSDRVSPLLVGTFGLVLAFVGVALVLLAPSLAGVVLGTVLVAAGYKALFPVADTVVMDAAPAGQVGTDIGAARAVFLSASALGPGFVGVVAEVASFTVAFWLLAAGLLGCVPILGRQYRRR